VGRYPPHDISHIIRNKQRACTIHGNTHRSATRLFLVIYKAREQILRRTCGPAVGKWHEDDFVTTQRLSIPRAVLPDDRATGIPRREERALIKRESE
jgi:hypothetical protein